MSVYVIFRLNFMLKMEKGTKRKNCFWGRFLASVRNYMTAHDIHLTLSTYVSGMLIHLFLQKWIHSFPIHPFVPLTDT